MWDTQTPLEVTFYHFLFCCLLVYPIYLFVQLDSKRDTYLKNRHWFIWSLCMLLEVVCFIAIVLMLVLALNSINFENWTILLVME